MLPIISKREDLLIFYKKLSENPQGFQRFVESYALDFCNQIEFKWGHIKEQDIHILAGVGLNGRYALAIAKELFRFTTKKVWVYIYSLENRLSEELNLLVDELRQIEALNLEVLDLAKELVLPSRARKNDLLIDGLAGYEQEEKFPQGYLELFSALNELDTIKLSIEVPSGITFSNVDLKREKDTIFRADYCWGIALPSLKMFLNDYTGFFGSCKTLNYSAEQFIPSFSKYCLVEDEEYRSLLHYNENVDRGKPSRCFILGFNPSTYGHLLISGRSALSAGVGELNILTNQEACLPLQMQQAELEVSEFDFNAFVEQEHYTYALGTPLLSGNSSFTWGNLLPKFKRSLVIGTSVSREFIANKSLLSLIPKHSCLLLSEEDLPCKTFQNQEDILSWVRDIAMEFQQNILLFSDRPFIFLDNGHIYLQGYNCTYSTAKSNLEILTGLLLTIKSRNSKLSGGGLLCLGSYIYQEAITLCQRKHKTEIVLAEHIIENISEVYTTLKH